jgi:hypothetical protein
MQVREMVSQVHYAIGVFNASVRGDHIVG